MTATRITVLISGNGTNLQALIDHIASGKLSATIVRVVSNRKNAYGLQRAEQAGIPTSYHNLLKYKKEHPSTEEGVRAAREKYDEDLAGIVLQDKPNLIACLGFMHVVSRKFLDPIYEAGIKIINLHPALPGQFDGAVSTLFATHSHVSYSMTPY
jgi:phosphoribosylglycinamide formyltransferase